MAKRRGKPVIPDIESTPRDFVMARLLAARNAAQAAMDAIDEAAALFVNPEDDPKLGDRKELVGDVLEALGCATRAAESAEEVLEQVDPAECEPWDEDGDDEEDEEDDA